MSVSNDLTLIDGGVVSTSTSGSGNAGSVKVSAGNIVIDGRDGVEFTAISSQAVTGSTGHAGSVEIAALGNVSILSGGEISSSTFAAGNAGTIKLTTGSLLIDSRSSAFLTGLSSQAGDGSGNAGSIDITARERIEVLNGGEISSSTFTAGHAGAINVRANEILIDRRGNATFTGITSAAETGSTGNAGSGGHAGRVEVVDRKSVG